jgi:hypothetical protein
LNIDYILTLDEVGDAGNYRIIPHPAVYRSRRLVLLFC